MKYLEIADPHPAAAFTFADFCPRSNNMILLFARSRASELVYRMRWFALQTFPACSGVSVLDVQAGMNPEGDVVSYTVEFTFRYSSALSVLSNALLQNPASLVFDFRRSSVVVRLRPAGVTRLHTQCRWIDPYGCSNVFSPFLKDEYPPFHLVRDDSCRTRHDCDYNNLPLIWDKR